MTTNVKGMFWNKIQSFEAQTYCFSIGIQLFIEKMISSNIDIDIK